MSEQALYFFAGLAFGAAGAMYLTLIGLSVFFTLREKDDTITDNE